MFGAKRQDCQGRLLQEVVRNVELQQLINDVIESGVIRAVGKRGQPVIAGVLQLDKLSQAVSYFNGVAF